MQQGTQPLPTQPLDSPTEVVDLSEDSVSGRRETRRP
jgi:hypothetical protein